MAHWQFEFGFVPSIAAWRHWASGHAASRVQDAGIARCWSEAAFSESLGGTSRTRWMDVHGNYMDVRVESGRVLDVSAALDLRVPYLEFVSDLTLAANRQEWLAITTEGRVFRPTVRRFLFEIQRSPALRAMRDGIGAVSRQCRRG